jgi:hypothetical protein
MTSEVDEHAVASDDTSPHLTTTKNASNEKAGPREVVVETKNDWEMSSRI